MQFELETGYKLLIVKKNETDKKYRLFCSKTPFSNEYVKIGMIDDLASIEMIKTAFKPFIGGINENY